MSDSLLQARHIGACVGENHLFRDLSLDIRPGTRLAILGANGCGKTTLLHTLAGLRSPTHGEVFLHNTPIQQMRRRRIAQNVGLMVQESHDPFPATVLEIAMSGLHPRLASWESPSKEQHEQAQHWLAQMELDGMAERSVTTLSGGERRRLAAVTLLMQQPAIYLLDEPVNHLDLRHQIQLLDNMKRQSEREHAVIMVLHDPNLAHRYCDEALLFFPDGTHRLGGCDALLNDTDLSAVYQHPVHRLQDGQRTLFVTG